MDNLLESDLFDRNHKGNSKQITIEINTPEIGTKIENFKENKILVNQKSKKDYYNNEYKIVIFYPFFNMEKDNKKTKAKYNLKYNYENDSYNLYIFKYSTEEEEEEEEIKIQINNKSLIRIMYDLNKKNIELYIFLKTVPKVYTKETSISKSSFFFERFKNNLQNYDYENLYRNIDKSNAKKYYKVKHSKTMNLNKINSNLILEKEDNYFREVSYFSMDDEYQNLYLNDLIIKISFINNRENHNSFKYLKKNLKYKKVKFKSNRKYYEMIKSINPQKQELIKDILEENKNIFYNNFKNLIPNLQFSINVIINNSTNKYF